LVVDDERHGTFTSVVLGKILFVGLAAVRLLRTLEASRFTHGQASHISPTIAPIALLSEITA
jgi:hypothetical protein